MEEINIGDYVRTNRGIIAKVVFIRPKNSFKTKNGYRSNSPERYFLDSKEVFSIIEKNLKKYSKNIIDLIEVGDYVNGERVTNIMDNGVGTEIGRFIAKEHIDTTLTHERYEQNCYKLEE